MTRRIRARYTRLWGDIAPDDEYEDLDEPEYGAREDEEDDEDEEDVPWQGDVDDWRFAVDELITALEAQATRLDWLVSMRAALIRWLTESGESFRFVAEACSLSVSTVHAIARRPPSELLERPPNPERAELVERALARFDAPMDRYEDAAVLARLGEAVYQTIYRRDRLVVIARALGVPVRRVAAAAHLSVGGVVAVIERRKKSAEFPFD